MTKPVLYSSPTCAPCKNVKTWLARTNVEYDELDIYDNAQVVQEATGMLQPPTILFNNTVIVGANYSRLADVFKR